MTSPQPNEDNALQVEHVGRRRLLKALAAGGVGAALLPKEWTRPIVDSMLLPAHAQGSVGSLTGTYTNIINGNGVGAAQSPSVFERLANAFIPAAHAVVVECIPNTIPCAVMRVFDNNFVRVAMRAVDNTVGHGSSNVNPVNGQIPEFDVFYGNPTPNVIATFSNCVVGGGSISGQVNYDYNSLYCNSGFTLNRYDVDPNANVSCSVT